MAKHARPPSDHVVFYAHAHAQTTTNTYSISVFVHACRRSRVDSALVMTTSWEASNR